MITDAMANQFKLDTLNALHLPTDTYKIALIKPSPKGDFDGNYGTYTAGMGGDEVASGGGYVQGGATLSGRAASLVAGEASVGWADAIWGSASISASGAVIYNATRSNKVIAVFNLRTAGGVPATITSTNGDFALTIPSSGTGIIRIA